MAFDFKNKERLHNLVYELEQLRYEKIQDIEHFKWYEDDGTVGKQKPDTAHTQIVEKGFRWQGYGVYNWLENSVSLPQPKEGKRLLALFDFGADRGTGNNSHFESLLYINGKNAQAVDGNHREVFLDSHCGATVHLLFRLWSGLNGGGYPADMKMEIRQAELAYLDKAADELYFFARNILETVPLLENDNPYKQWLVNELVEAFRLIDYTNPRSPEFYASVQKAVDYLNKCMKGQGKPDIHISLIGHTHIDVAWLWRLCHTREKAARSFSTVECLMEEYPEYIFLQSQAQLYDYIKTDYPEIFKNIQKRAANGQWEAAGAMWLECDCNIASGEALTRQILYGKRFFKREFNNDNDFLWLPDVFGYSWAMPQILRKAGVRTFVTSKISWNDANRMPYDTFIWRGIDGTEILTQFITSSEKNEHPEIPTIYTYNGDTRPAIIKGTWDNYQNKDLNRSLFIPYGYGDGGGGVNREMLERQRSLNKIPALPYVKTERLSSFLDRLHKTVSANKLHGYLPVWDGELYLEFHRGTYTSQAYTKKMNRRMEFMARETELLSVLSGHYRKDACEDKKTVYEAWKIILRNQFHDILPGSSIHEVYEDSKKEYAEAEQLLASVQHTCRSSLIENGQGYTVFNSASYERSDFVLLPETAKQTQYKNEAGAVLRSAVINGRVMVYCPKMPPLAFYPIYEDSARTETAPRVTAQKTGNGITVESPFYRIKWNEHGQISSLYDKKARREVFSKTGGGNILQIFEDKPRCFDAWELESTIDLKKEEITALVSSNIAENNLAALISFCWKYNKSTIEQTVHVYADSPRIDFKTRVDWQESQKILKAAFIPEIRATYARYDIQYGNLIRPVTRNTSWEHAKFETPAHKWIDFSENGFGLALLNDCKYGHDIKDNVMRISLLKSAVYPDYSADKGIQEFTYALLPHTGTFIDAKLEQYAFNLNNPLSAVQGRAQLTGSFISLTNPNVFVDCIKWAEDSDAVVVRFHEYAGSRGRVSLKLHESWAERYLWCEADLMENPLKAWKEGAISVPVKPYELITLLIRKK